jgi:hypothetical protein
MRELIAYSEEEEFCFDVPEIVNDKDVMVIYAIAYLNTKEEYKDIYNSLIYDDFKGKEITYLERYLDREKIKIDRKRKLNKFC